jgi:predicted transposase YbfD/YdcC
VITSATAHATSPATLATWVQGHWGLRTGSTGVRDVTFDEDRSQVSTGHSPQVMAALRNTAIALIRLTDWTNIAAGLRHHARHPDQTITRLLK